MSLQFSPYIKNPHKKTAKGMLTNDGYILAI